MPAWLGAPGAAVVEATWQGVVLAALVAAVGRAAGAGLPRLRHALAAGGVLVLSAGFLASAVRITVAAVSSSVKTIVAVADPALVEPVREVAFVEPAVLQWLGLAWCATVLVAAVRLLGGLAGVGRLMASGESTSTTLGSFVCSSRASHRPCRRSESPAFSVTSCTPRSVP